MKSLNIEKADSVYEEYLRDESRKTGYAGTISFPVSEDEVRETLVQMSESHIKVTIQGARTGVAAGAVPFGGHILNLSRMDRVTGIEYDNVHGYFVLAVQPGVVLSQLRAMLEQKNFNTEGWTESSVEALKLFKESGGWFFPPDPTETSASIGGMSACNASGACSFLYGPTRKYIEGLDIILMNGSGLSLVRRRDRTKVRGFSVSDHSGRTYEGTIPSYEMPAVKNASGYYSHDNMDMLDLFIGSEGTLGVATCIKLRLIHSPACVWGMMAFFSSEEDAVHFVREIRGSRTFDKPDAGGMKPAAIEFFNSDALSLLRKMKSENPAFSAVPAIPEHYHTAIYTEYHGDCEESVCSMVMQATGTLGACGADEEDTWLAANPKEMERLHLLRHALPEAVNLTIDMRRRENSGLTKLGTDMAVPDDKLEDVMVMYNSDLAEKGLDSVIFGHIGSNHVHVNILPRTGEEYELGRRLYLKWSRKVAEMGGTVSAEHGVGKLKTALLQEMYGDEGIRQMRAVKQVFDPEGLLNPGNLFDSDSGDGSG